MGADFLRALAGCVRLVDVSDGVPKADPTTAVGPFSTCWAAASGNVECSMLEWLAATADTLLSIPLRRRSGRQGASSRVDFKGVPTIQVESTAQWQG